MSESNKKKSGGIFRKLRIAFLLILLFCVGLDALMTKKRATDWDLPLWVAMYPINGDGSSLTSEYIESLDEDAFVTIENYFKQEAAQYGLGIDVPFYFKQAPEIYEVPPRPPLNGSSLDIIWWSLKFRYWSWKTDTFGDLADVRIYVVYYSPGEQTVLDHSLGLEKGMLGVVNAFSDERFSERNNVIIAHELLHTVGATDKYDLSTEMPIFPDGYGEPTLEPIFPQEKAEIMACKIVVSETILKMPEDLWETVIGKKTAGEINWIK